MFLIKEPEVKSQSFVFAVVFLAVGAVYVGAVHTVIGAVNAGFRANVYVVWW